MHLLFLLNKSLELTRMKKDMRSSTLNKQKINHWQGQFPSKVSSPSVEDLTLQLELEAKLSDDFSGMRSSMSCVNNSNMLRSTSKALNRYPRFSLDGRDAMHSSTSERNIEGRRSICCDRRLKGRLLEENAIGSRYGKGECVMWCKPGVVARLMGLEAMPLPLPLPLPISNKKPDTKDEFLAAFRMQNLRSGFERHH